MFVCQEVTLPNIPSGDSFLGQNNVAEDERLLDQAEGEGPFLFTLALQEVDHCFEG